MKQQWTTLSFRSDATFGDRIFINMPYRSSIDRANRLTMWVAPIVGKEDEAGAWRFHAKSAGQALNEMQTTELLASVFTLLAGHGYTPQELTFSTFAALAQRPQHHIPKAQRDAAKRHLKMQKSFADKHTLSAAQIFAK